MWCLKHKHFDVNEDELLLFEVSEKENVIRSRVISRSEGLGSRPCQAIFADGKWLIVGVASHPCDLKLPSFEGTGMISSLLLTRRLMERADEEKRIQLFARWEANIKNREVLDDNVVLTGFSDENLLGCAFCENKKHCRCGSGPT